MDVILALGFVGLIVFGVSVLVYVDKKYGE